MNIEDMIFKKSIPDFDKLISYGFKKVDCFYKYSKNIMNNSFQVVVMISKDGVVSGKVYDLELEDEYTNFRIENNIGSFASQVREEFETILKDIEEKCFTKQLFIGNQANRISNIIMNKYQDEPSFEWDSYPDFGVFKNKDTKKWYALIMNIDKGKLDDGKGSIEIVNVKIDENKIKQLLSKKGFYPAYHMNKKYWISVALDDTLKDEVILDLIEESYSYSEGSGVKKSISEWIVPANPKYYDIEAAFFESDVIDWKQGASINVGDIVYIYMGQPVSAIIYKCVVVRNNIPYDYNDGNVKIKYIMEIKLLEKYDKSKFPFKKLNEFGVNAVRSARFMPEELSKYINKN